MAATLSSAPATTSLSCRRPYIPPTGVLYEWADAPLDGFPVLDIERLGIRPPVRHLSTVDLSFEEGEPLTSEETGSIIEAVAPEWAEGNRHDLALALAGWCAGHHVPEDSAEPSLMSWQPATDR